MDDGQLRNEVITLLLAGHETTANALAWTFYLLARHPEAQERVHEEALAEEPGPFISQVFRESMRLFPPIWAMERRVVAEDELSGFRIPAGSTVVVSPWVTHRHPDFWEEPERFDPERFASGRPQPAYIPFGTGSRYCVGSHFAMTEAFLITTMVIREWRLRLAPEPAVVPQPGITLRARDGVPVLLERWPA